MNKRQRKSVLRALRSTRESLRHVETDNRHLKRELSAHVTLLKSVRLRHDYIRERVLFVTREGYFFYAEAAPMATYWRVVRPTKLHPYDVSEGPSYSTPFKTSEDTYRLQLLRFGHIEFKVFVSVEFNGDVTKMFNSGELPMP